MIEPIICFGQQPNGFFPKRFFAAKVESARGLQKKIGGKIVYFFHDSDADHRETITVFRDRLTGAEARLNFLQENKLQKNFSPLYAKRIPANWVAETQKQLPRFVDKPFIDMFNSVQESKVANFCLNMYNKLGLLEDIEVLRSGDKTFRQQANDLTEDFFADVEYEGEIVRAKIETNPSGGLTSALHHGGGKFTRFPITEPLEKWQKNAAANSRFAWMNSVIECTHYIYGEGEGQYLKFDQFPEVKFVERERIEDPTLAWIPKFKS